MFRVGPILFLLAFAPPIAASPVRIATRTTSLDVDADGILTSLVDRRTGRAMLARDPLDLFQLEVDTVSGHRFLGAREARSVEVTADRSVLIQYRDLAGTGVDARCRISSSAADDLLHFRLSATLPAGVTLTTLHYPLLHLATLGPATDRWVMGGTKGGIHVAPSGWPVGRSAFTSRPGSMAAAFGCYYDPDGGVTTQARDTRGTPLAVGLSRGGGGLGMQWIHSAHATGTYSMGYDVALGVFGQAGSTDWRHAADLYKRWAATQPWCRRTLAERTDLPLWLRSGPAMVRFHRGWLADIPSIDRWMRSYWKPWFGSTPLVTAYWGWEKVETWVTPDYFPVFPSDQQFRALAARNRAMGGHAFLWPSGYHYTLTYGRNPDGTFRWDDRDRFNRVARAHAVSTREGSVLVGARGWLEGGETATLCAGDPWTRRWFDAIAAGCAQRGADLVQVDQVVGGSFPACYSPDHGHPVGPGPWMGDVFHSQLTSMRRAMERYQPGSVACFEEPNELFIQQVGLQDYRDWEVVGQEGVEPASVFNYLYHEYLPTFQSNPQAGDRLQAAWCLVTGQMPHLIPSRLVGPGPALENGRFEEWTGPVPAGWDKVGGYQGEVWSGACAADSSVVHEGRRSLRLANSEAGQTVQVSQNVFVGSGFRPGGRYRIRLWLKSGGVAVGNAVMFGTFTEGMRPTWSGSVAIPAQAGDWITGQEEFVLPEGSKLLRIMLHLRGPGTVWIDGVVLEHALPGGRWEQAPRPALPDDHAFMRRWVELYHGVGRPYLQHGVTLHPPALQCATVALGKWNRPAILHNAYRAADGSRAVVLVNASDADQAATLSWNGKPVPLRMKPWEIQMIASGRTAR